MDVSHNSEKENLGESSYSGDFMLEKTRRDQRVLSDNCSAEITLAICQLFEFRFFVVKLHAH